MQDLYHQPYQFIVSGVSGPYLEERELQEIRGEDGPEEPEDVDQADLVVQAFQKLGFL